MATDPLPQISPTPEPVAPAMSEGARILNTFIAPSRTFTDLRRNASWWGPWILISIFSIAFFYAVQKQVTFEQISRNQIAHSARASEQFDRLPADQQAQRLQFSGKLLGYIGYSTPLVMLLVFLIESTALWATFNIGVGAQTSFKQAFAILMYAGLPGLIHATLAIVTLFAGVNPESFDLNNPVGSNLAYFLDPETTGKFVRGMASSVDLISIWTIVLIGIGYSCTSKVKRSTAIGIVAGWFLLYKLATSALASLG
jgi:hypothetical protein